MPLTNEQLLIQLQKLYNNIYEIKIELIKRNVREEIYKEYKMQPSNNNHETTRKLLRSKLEKTKNT